MSATALNDARFTEATFSQPVRAYAAGPKPSIDGVDISHVAIALGRKRKRDRDAANEELTAHNLAGPPARRTSPLSANAKAIRIHGADLARARLEARYFGVIKTALDRAKQATLSRMRKVVANEVGADTAQAAVVALFRMSAGQLQVLLGQRSDTGEWALPGGHVKSGETPAEGARRELQEETGTSVTSPLLLHVTKITDDGKQVAFYTSLADPNFAPTPTTELRGFKWVEATDPPKDLPYGNSDLIPELAKAATAPQAANAVAVDWLFELEPFAEELLGALRDTHEDAVPGAASAAMNRLSPGEKFETPEGLVEKFVVQRENKLKDVPQNIYDEIKRAIEEGSAAGDSEQEIAHTIEGAFDQVYEGRARTVARTEAASAYGAAEHAAIGEAGFGFKTWVTARDDRVRDSHAEMDGETVPVDEEFSNGLDYPGDPDGEPEEVINCRCVTVAADNEDGSVDED